MNKEKSKKSVKDNQQGNTISFKMILSEVERLTSEYPSLGFAAKRAAESWTYIRQGSIQEIKGKFTDNELLYLVEMVKDSPINYKKASNKDYILADLKYSQAYETALVKKYNIRFEELISKVEILTSAQVFFLNDFIHLYWEKLKNRYIDADNGNSSENLSEYIKKMLPQENE